MESQAKTRTKMFLLICPPETETLEMLAQWSDLIIFDYITGNCDRFGMEVQWREKWGSVFNKFLPNVGLG